MTPSPVRFPATAVVVTYASRETVGPCLEALRRSYDARLLRAVVVDNASPDGTADRVAREHPWVRLIRSPDNLGYGRGCNLGFQEVGTPYVLFMNPDVVIESDAVSTLIRFMDDRPAAGLAAPATLCGFGEYNHAGGLPTPGSMIAAFAGLPSAGHGRFRACAGDAAVRTDWLCGAVLLARSRAFRRLGGFDPRFFLYFEETDLCARARRAGYDLWVVGEALARHASNASARAVDPSLPPGGCLPHHYYRSRYYYLRKHFGWTAAVGTEALELGIKAAKDAARWIFRRPGPRELSVRLKGPLFRMPSLGSR
jgi:GT2 family glycosyltransferase